MIDMSTLDGHAHPGAAAGSAGTPARDTGEVRYKRYELRKQLARFWPRVSGADALLEADLRTKIGATCLWKASTRAIGDLELG